MNESTDGKDIILAKFHELVTPCDCEHADCSTNYGKCKNIAELNEKLLSIYKKLCNARSSMLSDLVSGVYDEYDNARVRRKLAEAGEMATAQFAAVELMAMAVIITPKVGTPLEYLAALRSAGEKFTQSQYRVEVTPLPGNKEITH